MDLPIHLGLEPLTASCHHSNESSKVADILLGPELEAGQQTFCLWPAFQGCHQDALGKVKEVSLGWSELLEQRHLPGDGTAVPNQCQVIGVLRL